MGPFVISCEIGLAHDVCVDRLWPDLEIAFRVFIVGRLTGGVCRSIFCSEVLVSWGDLMWWMFVGRRVDCVEIVRRYMALGIYTRPCFVNVRIFSILFLLKYFLPAFADLLSLVHQSKGSGKRPSSSVLWESPLLS